MVRQAAVSVHARGAGSRAAVTGSSGVDDVLNDSSIHQTQRCQEEANGDASNGLEFDFQLAQNGVNDLVQDGDEDDDRDGIKVLHQIIGHSVSLHLASLRDEVARELGVAHPEDRVEGKDLASPQGTLQLLDEVIVPRHGLNLAVCFAPRRLRSVRVAGDDHQADSLESVGDDRSLRRADDVELLRDDQHNDTNAEHEEAHKVCGPEALVHFHEGRGEKRKTANVDASVKHHVDPLVCDRRVDDHTLTSLSDSCQGHLLAGVLVGDERRDVGLDTTSSKSDNDNCGDVATESSAIFDGNGERCCP